MHQKSNDHMVMKSQRVNVIMKRCGYCACHRGDLVVLCCYNVLRAMVIWMASSFGR